MQNGIKRAGRNAIQRVRLSVVNPQAYNVTCGRGDAETRLKPYPVADGRYAASIVPHWVIFLNPPCVSLFYIIFARS